MKILVCITHVPDTTSKIQFNGNELDKNNVNFVIGPYDDYALARAVELKDEKGAEVTVLNVGTADSEPSIRKALAIGADKAVRINAEPKEAQQVSRLIANYAKDQNFDLILMGRESSDYNGGLVHGMVGEMLGVPSLNPVMTLTFDGDAVKMTKEIEGGHADVEAKLPLVLGCQEPIAEWKIANMRGIMMARKKPLEVVEPESLEEHVVYTTYENQKPRSEVQMFEPEQIDQLISALQQDKVL